MASTAPNFNWLALILVTLVSFCSCFGSVPLLIWSNKRDITPANHVALGHHSSLSEVQNQLDSFLASSRETVIFLQDKLSLDDLTKNRRKAFNSKSSVFSNIQTLLESNVNTVIPSMLQKEDEKSFVSHMKEKFVGKVEDVYSSDIEEWQYDASKGGQRLYIFHLPPVKGSTEKGQLSILSRNDDIVGKIAAQFEKNVKYVGVLTSAEPSSMVEKMENEDLVDGKTEIKRHLLSSSATSLDGKLFNFKGCVFLYAKSIILTVGTSSVNVVNASYTLSGHCASNETSVSITFEKDLPVNVTQFELRMSFLKLSNTDWTCTNMDVTYSGNLNGTKATGVNVVFPSCREKIVTPADMSYSCGDLSLQSNKTKLSFGHFQVQPFGLKNNRFSSAFDCVGFFTTPILTGLFATALLISIAFGGILAMMSISTMDRFDDPKGPTIQVPHE